MVPHDDVFDHDTDPTPTLIHPIRAAFVLLKTHPPYQHY